MDTVQLVASVLGALSVSYVLSVVMRPSHMVRPRLSFAARMLNVALTPLAYFRVVPPFKPLSLRSLKSQASKAAKGLKNFGPDWYEKPYEQTMDMVNKANYSPIGRAAAHDFFLRRLVAKLRLEDELSRNPSVLQQPIRKPLFVVGLPRTGTTFLHRLLSLDPATRAPRTYELFDPVPRNPADPVKDKKSRVRFVQKAIDQLHMCVPHFQSIHEVGAELPEECMMSIGCDIPMLFATFHVLIGNPEVSYSWRPGQAYKNYRRVLQLLQEQAGEEKRWTLKCPVHLGLLEFLVEGFPDARVVWTHRDPKQAVGSLCSFVRATQDMHEGGLIDMHGLGKDVEGFAEEWIRRADRFMEGRNSEDTCSVMYTELIKDPVGTVRSIYKDMGYEFTEEYEGIMREYIRKNKEEREAKKKKGGKLHEYKLKDYGLEDEVVEKGLGWYRAKYFN